MALGGIVLLLGWARSALTQFGQFALWWSILAGGVALLVVLLAVTGRILSLPVLRILWCALIAAMLLCQVTVFLGYRGEDPGALLPWIWGLEPLSVGLMVLLVRPAIALGYTVVSALTPLLSGLLFLGVLPQAVCEATPLHIGNFIFVVIFLGIRLRLDGLHTAELRSREENERQRRAFAALRRRRELARVVHDEVLSTLTAATRFRGLPAPDELREEALRALEVLEPASAGDDEELPTEDAVRWLSTAALRIAEGVTIRVDAQQGRVPRVVVEEISRALAEALRNSAAHTPDPTRSRITGSVSGHDVTLEVTDDGTGFDIEAISSARLGVRESILARMRDLPGGSAHLQSDANGTRVELRWRR